MVSVLDSPLCLFSPPLPSEVGPLNTARRSGERCKLPQLGLGEAPAAETTCCILESKSAALVAVVFVNFPKKKCNFLHKNKPDIVRRIQFLIRRRPRMSFPPGAVATIALWKSAPVYTFQSKHNYGQSNLTSPPRTNRSFVFAMWCQCLLHLKVSSSGPHEFAAKRHFDRFVRFCRAPRTAKHTDTYRGNATLLRISCIYATPAKRPINSLRNVYLII